MRKLIVLSFITLDGIMQAPGGPEEDPSGGFKYGGWSVGYFDESLGNIMAEQMGHPFDLLLGRKTYDIFAAYWPRAADDIGQGSTGQRNMSCHIGRSVLNGKRRCRSMGTSSERSRRSRQKTDPSFRFMGAAT
jgi:hypothetical protein